MPSESATPAPDIEAAAQTELRKIAEDLKVVQERLRAVQEGLPVAPDRGEDECEDEMDTATELRSVIDCVLVDSIGPALRDLLAAAAYSQKGRPGGR